MSVRLMARVWDHADDLSGSDLLVMLALADAANDDGTCWPSRSRIARRARISKRHAARVLRGLQESGYITVEPRYRDGGGRRSNVYRLHVPSSDMVSSGDDNLSRGVVTRVSPGGDMGVTPPGDMGVTLNHKKEPSRKRKGEDARARAENPPPDRFAGRFDGEEDVDASGTMVAALGKVTGLDPALPGPGAKVRQAAAELVRAGYSADVVLTHYGRTRPAAGWWWYSYDWRGKKQEPPRPAEVVETIGQTAQEPIDAATPADSMAWLDDVLPIGDDILPRQGVRNAQA